jgi:hypothetical protein
LNCDTDKETPGESVSKGTPVAAVKTSLKAGHRANKHPRR